MVLISKLYRCWLAYLYILNKARLAFSPYLQSLFHKDKIRLLVTHLNIFNQDERDNRNRIVTGGSSCVVDLYVSRFDARHEDSVTVHKLAKGVSDWIAGPPYPDGLHHARVSQLTNTQLSVK